MNERDIINLIKQDKWMMSVLGAARELDLPDWMIGAGFVRNKVWDHLHGIEREVVATNDIDLIYYDADEINWDKEQEYARQLSKIIDVEWEVKNQARMHEVHDRVEHYANTEEALSEWVETATCVAVRLEKDNSITLFAPHGIVDLVNMLIKLTPAQSGNTDLLMKRVTSKKWLQSWPKLQIVK